RRDVAAILATLVYQLGYETGDVDRAATEAAMPGNYASDAALGDLRRAGVRADCFERFDPTYAVSSAAGEQVEMGTMASTRTRRRRTDVPHGLRPMLERLQAQAHQIQQHLRRVEGFGSNAWAVAGSHTRDGAALLAGDGHLPLTVPSLFYQIGL